MTNPLQIVIGDDNPAVLDAVRHMLQKEFQVVAALQESRAVVARVTELQPDILVLDVSMDDMNGFEITRKLKSDHCRSKIIFLTVHEDLEFIHAAFDAGASGYVFKSRMNIDLPAAINAVRNDKVFLPDAPISQFSRDGEAL